MDRGRVGTLAIGNKTIRDQMIQHQQDVHMERIQKIKTRKPGTSSTLDNTAPVIVKAALTNPRKVAKRIEFNEMTEKENRVLLQRISNTLTAPPKITDADYQAMKKLCGNMKGGKQVYEENIAKKHHQRYLKHLKGLGPYYNPKEWEMDYLKQKVQQHFMRQVPYERPKDHVTTCGPNFEVLGSIHDDKNAFKPHHTQLPGYKSNRDLTRVKSTTDLHSGGDRSRSAGQVNRIKGVKSDKSLLENEYEDDFDQGEDANIIELACTHRFIRTLVVTEVLNNNPEEENLDRWGEISCGLQNQDTFVISAKIKIDEDEDGTTRPALDAEAEIDVEGIADIHGLCGTEVLASPEHLARLGKYLSNSVDLKVEDDVARIVLNLSDLPKQDEQSATSSKNNGNGSILLGKIKSSRLNSTWFSNSFSILSSLYEKNLLTLSEKGTL